VNSASAAGGANERVSVSIKKHRPADNHDLEKFRHKAVKKISNGIKSQKLSSQTERKKKKKVNAKHGGIEGEKEKCT